MEKRDIRLTHPLVDFQNPFYCPAVPAATYIKKLRQTVSKRNSFYRNSNGNDSSDLFTVFAKMLDQSERLGDSDSTAEFLYDSENDWIIGRNLAKPAAKPGQPHARRKRRQALSPIVLSANARPIRILRSVDKTLTPRAQSSGTGSPVNGRSWRKSVKEAHQSDTVRPLHWKKRKLERAMFPDLMGTPQYARSDSTAQDVSFEIEVKREKISFDVSSSPTLLPHPVNSGPSNDIGSAMSSAEHVIGNIERVLPGLRLRDKLGPKFTTQQLADHLADRGLITPTVLDILRATDITSLSLAASLADEPDGLNICRPELLAIFSKPHSFSGLTELSFSGSLIKDFDLVHVSRLPALSGLYLNNTGIGNEAVLLLVPLKMTLTRLSLATNPYIDSDCVPALLLMEKLAFLSILNTSVDMCGLRRLAAAAYEGIFESIDIEIPTACEDYIDSIDDNYLLYPKPPLTTDPAACVSLTDVALRLNLQAHATANPAIVPTGTREEMVERLSEILKRRKMDLIVAQMLRG